LALAKRRDVPIWGYLDHPEHGESKHNPERGVPERRPPALLLDRGVFRMTTPERDTRFQGGWHVVPLDKSPEDSAQRKRFIRESRQGDQAHPETEEQA